jgi:16S rRNA G966 N2-methylase RsmD
MPFACYGAKHGMAARYPRPRHAVIVEPFAGSAAYSIHHASAIDHAVLIDADERVVALWRDIQTMTPADVDAVFNQINDERFTHPMLAGMAGGSQMEATLSGKSRAVTPRMRDKWINVHARIVRSLPHIRDWQIMHGDYHDAPDIDATWFVDPPYQENGTMAGAGYRCAAAAIDFDHLGDWCRDRLGFTIVCEQSPADWLPFHPFAIQTNGAGEGALARQEVIWRSDMEQPSLFGPAA